MRLGGLGYETPTMEMYDQVRREGSRTRSEVKVQAEWTLGFSESVKFFTLLKERRINLHRIFLYCKYFA